jgi:hypothetical protein
MHARLTDCISLTAPCSRQHSDILSFFAITGGLLWVLRSRSMARKTLEDKQIGHGSGSTLEQGVS